MSVPVASPPARLPSPPLPPPPPLRTTVPMTATVLRARLRASWNSARRTQGGRRRVMQAVIFTFVALLILGPIFAGIALLLRFDAARNPAEALRYPPAIFVVAALALLFTNFPATLNALYYSPTLSLLLAAPVPFRTVFTVTLIEGALAAPFVLGLALLALIAYGIGVGAGIAYYLIVVIGLIATAVFVTALTQMLVIGALRVIPAQRAKEGLTLLGAIVTVAAYGVYYSTRFARGGFGGNGGGNGSGTAITTLHDAVDRIIPVARMLPPGWAGFGAAAAQRGDVIGLVAWLVALLGATAVVIALAANVFRHAYLVGWSAIRTAPSRRVANDARTGTLDRIGSGWSPQVRAVAVKEVRTLVRDTRRLSVLVRSAGFALVYLFVFVFGGNQGGGRGGSFIGANTDFWFRALFVAFVVGGLASGVSAYTFGAEGQQFALYRLAPVTARTLLFAKWLAGMLFTAPIGCVLAVGVGIFLGGTPGQIIVLTLFTLWYALGSTANAVATAAIGAQFDQNRPDRSTNWSGSVVRLGVSMAFFLGSLLFWGALVFPGSARIPYTGGTAADYGGVRLIAAVVGAVLALGGLALAASVGSARLTRLLRPPVAEETR